MDRLSEKQFLLRRMDDKLHKSSLRTQSNRIAADAIRAVDMVFNHVPAYFGNGTTPTSDAVTDQGIPSIEWISTQLYNHFYSVPTILRDYGGLQLEPQDFLHQICTPSSSVSRNSLFFLTGDIGTGKTSFLNFLITKHGLEELWKKRILFVRLNVDLKQRTGNNAVSKIFFDLSKKFSKVLKKLMDGELLTEFRREPQRYEELAKLYEELTSTVESQKDNTDYTGWFSDVARRASRLLGKRLLIIFDNLDYFFHENDRYLFMSDSDTGENAHLETVKELVTEFYHGNSIGGIGASALFVIRTDSYEMLQSSRNLFPGADDAFSDNKNLFRLIKPNWQEVVERRTELLKHAISQITPEGKRIAVSESLGHVIESLRNINANHPLHEHLEKLSSFGLRSVIEFFKQYTWLSKEGVAEEASSRIIRHAPLGLLVLMLGNNLLYSQRHSRFPNVYTARVSQADAEHVNVVMRAQRSIPVSVKLTEALPVTFWLKRLLLAYIRHRNKEQIRAIDITNLFCNPKDGSYDEGLVRLCLGEFAETHASNLVAVRRIMLSSIRRLGTDDIVVTERALHCLEAIFDRFAYLQLVVDDFDLPVPRCLEDEFRFQSTNEHYGYLVAASPDYATKLRNMVRSKARKVSSLLAILKVAYECEKERFDPVFKKLVDFNVELPNPESIANRVFYDEFRLLQEHRVLDANETPDFFRTIYIEAQRKVRQSMRLALGLSV